MRPREVVFGALVALVLMGGSLAEPGTHLLLIGSAFN